MTQRFMRQTARKQFQKMRPALFAAACALLIAPAAAMAQVDHLDPEYAAGADEPAAKPEPAPAPATPAPVPHTSEPAQTPIPASQQAAAQRPLPTAPKHATIHPNCILSLMPDRMGKESGFRSLDRCEAENQDVKYETTENGMILMEQDGKSGYFAYHQIYEDKDHMLAVAYESTGGTSTYSYITDVSFVKDAQGGTNYEVRHTFGGGDRCENGIASVTNTPGTKTLTIKSDITPSALFEVSKNPAYAQRAGNRELPFCSYCCAGEATYQYEVGSKENPKLVSLRFDPQKIHDMDDQTNVGCFLNVLERNPYVRDYTVLPDKSDLVLRDFIEHCVQPAQMPPQ